MDRNSPLQSFLLASLLCPLACDLLEESTWIQLSHDLSENAVSLSRRLFITVLQVCKSPVSNSNVFPLLCHVHKMETCPSPNPGCTCITQDTRQLCLLCGSHKFLLKLVSLQLSYSLKLKQEISGKSVEEQTLHGFLHSSVLLKTVPHIWIMQVDDREVTSQSVYQTRLYFLNLS